MNQAFIGIVNQTLAASLLIIAVIAVRFIIKRAPKWITCALWGLVAIKLVLPFSMESIFSLVPSSRPIPSDIEYSTAPHIETGVPAMNQLVNPVLEASFTPQPVASLNPLQIVISVCSVVWLIGVASLLLYLLISYFILRKKVQASQNIYENVFICDEVASPFILGIIKPGIYLPSGLSADAVACVLEHERAHLKRYDHIWKLVGFLILCVYWFNPLCWIAYVLLCRDIELACDEKVTKDKDRNWKAAYCQALLECNVQRRRIAACPLAFGEVSVKNRIKSVLNYKKPAFWIVATAIVISVMVAVCFMTDPVSKTVDADADNKTEDKIEYAEPEQEIATEDQNPVYAEGSFDNIMGYSGYYIFYDTYPTDGYYYANDGTLLARVWGAVPEEVGMTDLDGDGKNELIAGLQWGDGATDVVVYKEFENGIRYAYCSELLDEPYDNMGIGSLGVEYLKNVNEVKISYWIDAEQKFRTSTYDINCYLLTWWIPDWLDTTSQIQNTSNAVSGSGLWGDQRDWTCGTIAEITEGTVNGTDFTISLKYFIREDDSEMIEKLGLTEYDFPNGYDIEPVGDTQVYPISENCEFIFIDWNHTFDSDSRVKSYDEVHVITEEYSVFKEYLDTYTDLNQQIFFYDIEDGRIQTIYETWLP